MSPLLSDDKTTWRAWARDLPEPSSVIGDAIVEGLRRFLHDAPHVGRVLTFRPMTGEVDLDPLLGEFDCAVTRTWPAGRLSVHPADAAVERHRWGYLQPVAGAPEVELHDIGLVLVPGLLFDVGGGRLGHGAGYYDRLLPQLKRSVAFVGIAAASHIVARVPVDDHDVFMTHLATQDGVRPVRAR